MDENEMVMTFIGIQEAPSYKSIGGYRKPFSETIEHRDMAKMGLRSWKIKDFTALKVVAEHL